ncbi:MAG: DUF932 domain-containing protein [Verrucomicrobiota bacterium]
MLNAINRTYGQHARFDNAKGGMTEDQLRAAAPSVFAMTAHESRSERFRPIPTIEVVRGLKKEGFVVVGAKQSVSRIPGKSDYTKHLLRLRREDDRNYQVGDTVAEMLLKNANDGTSIYDLFAGLFRIRCLNSLVAMQESISNVKVRHTGKDIIGQVIEGTFSVIEDAKLALAAPQDWSQIKLDRDERMAMAKAARVLRFGDAEGQVNTPITAEQLLEVRRHDDQENNLWTNFNVVQENVIRGGLHGVALDANNRRRRMTTRQVNGIDQDVKLNRALWTLANEMAKIKGWQAPSGGRNAA